MLDAVILIATCVINLMLGLIVYTRNPKAITSRAFLLITFFTSSWAVSNYFTEYTGVSLTVNKVANSFAYLFAFLAVAFGLRFVVNFLAPSYMGFGKIIDNILFGLGVVTAFLSVTPQVAGRVTMVGDELQFSVGQLLPLYVLAIMLFLALVVFTLIRIMRRATGTERQQAGFILLGFTATPILGLFTNAIIPVLTSDWHTTNVGPITTVLLVGSISYAIVRHRLFDIRLAVARSVAYSLSVASVFGLYAIATLVVARVVFDLKFGLKEEIFLSVLSAFAVFAFQPVKNFFNKVSNSIFYRDAYDAQEVLDRLTALLARTVSIKEIEDRTQDILMTSIRPAYVRFLLVDDAAKEDKKTLQRLLESNVFLAVADELSPHNHAALHAELRRHDISVAVRLRTTHEDMGFLLLGHRRSGLVYSGAEQRLLSTAADEIAIGLQNALRFREIERFNVTLQEKIDDATRKLRNANDKLRRLNETKDDFISMASHQLRTPLTSVKGYVSMVLDGDAGKITRLQRRLLNQSFVSSQRMVYLISDLLNVSRLKTGKFIIEPVHCNLAKVIEEEVEQLQETAKSRHLTLDYQKPEHFPTLMLDETKLRQVIMNFLDNAVYYTPAGGHIEVHLQDRPQSIEFTVVDDGIGVPRHEQHHLFTKFFRAPNAKRARPDGTGLGLFMAKKVIIAQGGAIIFKSQEGKGSTFGFTFAKAHLLPETFKMPAPENFQK